MDHVTEIRRAINASDVAHLAAREIIETLDKALSINAEVNLSLTGGTVGILTLEALAEQPDLERISFDRVHVWWGDERFVEATSADRNAVQAREALLKKVNIPESNIHEFPASNQSQTLAAAKTSFENSLIQHFGVDVPYFDLTILGMGPDGHIASLFPGHEALSVGEIVVAESNSPKPPSERLSFSFDVLNNSEKVIFVVSGIDKASAVKEVHTNEECELPAARIAALGQTIWFIDQAAGAEFWSC
jgi:6-phosphogluconolactonase